MFGDFLEKGGTPFHPLFNDLEFQVRRISLNPLCLALFNQSLIQIPKHTDVSLPIFFLT